MVEVFKTNVKLRSQADMLLEEIHTSFKTYKANFDLEDCDNILRVMSNDERIEQAKLIKILNGFGFEAEVLPDIILYSAS